MTNTAPPVDSAPASFMSRSALAQTARNGLWILSLALLTYYALFRLPFSFPPRQRLLSASYTFGFNNSAAILAEAGLLGLVTLYLLVRGKNDELPIVFPPQRAAESTRFTSIFLFSGMCYAALTFAMYIYDIRVAPPIMWETRHLLHRSWLIDLYGLRPYTQVAAEYGPILTYAPTWIYSLLKSTGASYEFAYFAAHFLLNLAGLWCIYYVLSRAIMPESAQVLIFVILAIAGFLPYMGINGVLMRYLFPFAALLLGYRALTSIFAWRSWLASWIIALGIVLLLLITNILLSPEIGLAFALGWLVFAVLRIHSEVRVMVVSLVALATAALLCWLFVPAAYYFTLLRFSEGANNLPLLPAPHILLYILTLFLVVPPLLAASVRGSRIADEPGAAICGAFGILCVVMVPGALGRCDPPHVLLFGMGTSMLLMIRLANNTRRKVTMYIIAYTAVFIVFVEAVNGLVFYGVSSKTLRSHHPFAAVIQRLLTASDNNHPDAATLTALDRYPHLGLPYASLGDPVAEKYVVTQHKLEPEYYVSVVGIYTPAALEHKLEDVAKMEYLLVPADFATRGIVTRDIQDPCAGYVKSIRQWFLYPVTLPCRAIPFDPLRALRAFIADRYKIIDQIGSWVVLRRIDDTSNLPPPSSYVSFA